MSAFIKLRPSSRLTYAGIKPAAGITVSVNPTNYSASIRAAEIAGKEGPTSILQPGQSGELHIGTVKPKKYTAMIVFNQAIVSGSTGVPSMVMVEAGEEVDITLSIKAGKKLDLAKSGPLAKLYLLD